MNNTNLTIKNNLKEYRLKAGYTQQEVANLLGLKCQDRISHWENGNNIPNLMNLAKLSRVYKTDMLNLYSL